jgi:hypothetical protein
MAEVSNLGFQKDFGFSQTELGIPALPSCLPLHIHVGLSIAYILIFDLPGDLGLAKETN